MKLGRRQVLVEGPRSPQSAVRKRGGREVLLFRSRHGHRRRRGGSSSQGGRAWCSAEKRRRGEAGGSEEGWGANGVGGAFRPSEGEETRVVGRGGGPGSVEGGAADQGCGGSQAPGGGGRRCSRALGGDEAGRAVGVDARSRRAGGRLDRRREGRNAQKLGAGGFQSICFAGGAADGRPLRAGRGRPASDFHLTRIGEGRAAGEGRRVGGQSGGRVSGPARNHYDEEAVLSPLWGIRAGPGSHPPSASRPWSPRRVVPNFCFVSPWHLEAPVLDPRDRADRRCFGISSGGHQKTSRRVRLAAGKKPEEDLPGEDKGAWGR